jgi:hypothetical protein
MSGKMWPVMTTHRSSAHVIVQPSLDRLAQLAKLGQNWDSYGGVPPSAQAIDSAHRVIVAAAERFAGEVGDRARPYAVAPLADGCVQVTWRGSVDELEVEIGPRDSVGYLLIKGRGNEETFEEGEGISTSETLDLVGRVLLARGDG